MKIYKESKLNNGFKIITGEDINSETVNLLISVKAGSRYEASNERGYSHLLEHMLLKGTKKKPSAYEVELIADKAGALLNASTGNEIMQIYAQVAKEKWKEIFELIGDITLYPLIDNKFLENEKNVVIQEINRTFDNPQRLLWIETLKKIYENHPLSNDPLAKKEEVSSATSDKLRIYHEKFFLPDRMALFVIGNVNHQDAVNFSEKIFGRLNSKELPKDNFKLNIKKGIDFMFFKGNHNYFNFNFVSERADFKEDFVLRLISYSLAGFGTSLLHYELREKGLLYGISASNYLFEDSNLFYIETSSSFPEKVMPIILEKLLNFEKYFTPDVFNDYKEQMINLWKRLLNDPFTEIRFLSNSWRLYGKLVTREEMTENIKNLDYKYALSVKNKFITKDKLFIMQLGEKKTAIDF